MENTLYVKKYWAENEALLERLRVTAEGVHLYSLVLKFWASV
jgi:hypothetical protein